MGRWYCETYRGYLIRRDYGWDTLYWAEKNQERVCFGSSPERVRKRLDRKIDEEISQQTRRD